MSRRVRGVNLTGPSSRKAGTGLQGVERLLSAMTRLRPGTASPIPPMKENHP